MSARERSDRRLTLEEYERLPTDDGYRDELSRGRLVREPQPGYQHNSVAGNIYHLLRLFVAAHALGRVTLECGYRLPKLPPTVRGPDVAFIRPAKVPTEPPVGWLNVAPDLAIEVVSPGNRRKYIEDKIADYFESGTEEIWIVHPRKRTVIVYRAGAEPRVLHEKDVLTSTLLPGLELPLRDVFAH